MPSNQLAGTTPDPVPAGRPRLRGRSHQIAFGVTLVSGPALVLLAPTPSARTTAGIYSASLSGLFGVSALLHRRTWGPAALRRMRHLDHSMIFVAIAGSYTPIAALALRPPLSVIMLGLVWAGAVIGGAVTWCGLSAPPWARVAPYLAIGWIAVMALPQIASALGAVGTTLIALGGVLYSAGAVVYARRRPDPVPAVFGYHEVFHALVIAAAALHYTAIAVYVTPRA